MTVQKVSRSWSRIGVSQVSKFSGSSAIFSLPSKSLECVLVGERDASDTLNRSHAPNLGLITYACEFHHIESGPCLFGCGLPYYISGCKNIQNIHRDDDTNHSAQAGAYLHVFFRVLKLEGADAVVCISSPTIKQATKHSHV